MDRSRLSGWKSIARFIGRDARTAQNWERERGLPVHRLPGGRSSTVFAYADEIGAWMETPMQATACMRQDAVPGLVVLPFDYLAHDSSRTFVADGLAQQLIGRLAATSLSSMRVVSWTTARAYRDAGLHAPALARELSIRYLVEGSVIETGNRWTIDIRIVDAHDDRVVLANRFACPGRAILLLQTEIAEAVAGHLALHLAGDYREPMWTHETDPRGFVLFLDGVRKLARGAHDSTVAALQALDEALVLDPHLLPACAHKGLGLLHADQQTAWLKPDVQREVRALAARCAAESEGLVCGAILDGLVGRNDCDWERIDQRLGRMVAANPSTVVLRLLHAGNLLLRRRFDDVDETLAPVPGLERSASADLSIATARLWSRDFPGAIERFDAMLRDEPTHVYASMMRFMAAIYLADAQGARRYGDGLPLALRTRHGPLIEGCMAVVEGNMAVARARRADAEQSASESRLGWYHVAMLDGLLGNAEAAAANLSRSAARHEQSSSLAAVDPAFDRVRDHAQFRRAVRAMGLPE